MLPIKSDKKIDRRYFCFTMALLAIGCVDKVPEDQAASMLAGTWYCPAPGQPARTGEWGPTRIKYILDASGKIDVNITIESEDGQSLPETIEEHGTYRIEGSKLIQTIEDRSTEFEFQLKNQRLVLHGDNGETYEFVKAE
ncbi:MAG: hypothetical protein CME32_31295 [Gimesia sp.]|nr:hypothetical protein [Gimesia sp.]